MVLAIDDDRLMLRCLGKILGNEGLLVDSLDAGIRIAETHKPEVIVLDVYIKGSKSIEEIPRLIEASQAAVVVIATMPCANDRNRAMELGATEFLAKVEIAKLASVIENARVSAAPLRARALH